MKSMTENLKMSLGNVKVIDGLCLSKDNAITLSKNKDLRPVRAGSKAGPLLKNPINRFLSHRRNL